MTPCTASTKDVTNGPTSKDWEPHREQIIELYCKENMTLKEVVAEMREKHGFVASYVRSNGTSPDTDRYSQRSNVQEKIFPMARLKVQEKRGRTRLRNYCSRWNWWTTASRITNKKCCQRYQASGLSAKRAAKDLGTTIRSKQFPARGPRINFDYRSPTANRNPSPSRKATETLTFSWWSRTAMPTKCNCAWDPWPSLHAFSLQNGRLGVTGLLSKLRRLQRFNLIARFESFARLQRHCFRSLQAFQASQEPSCRPASWSRIQTGRSHHQI